MRPREDRGGRLALELVERHLCVLEGRDRVRAILQEGADERPVLVERRAACGLVLLEREREVTPVIQLVEHRRESAQAERAQRVMEVRLPGHPFAYAPGRCSPLFGSGPGWQVGHQ